MLLQVLAIRSGMSQFSSAGTTTAVNGIAATGVGHNVQGGQLDDSAQRSRRTSKRRHDDGRTHKHKRVCSGEDSNGDDNTDTDSSLGHAARLVSLHSCANALDLRLYKTLVYTIHNSSTWLYGATDDSHDISVCWQQP